MKNINLFIVAAYIALSSCGKKSVDLENVSLKEDATTLVGDRKSKVDKLEMLTGLPGYLVEEVEGYSFGGVEVPKGGSVEFLLTTIAEKKLAGMDINYKTDTTAKLVSTYLFKKYGKPKQLQNIERAYDSADNAYRSSAAYLWSNVKPGVSMVLLNKNEEINKQPWHTSEIIILRNDVTPASPLNASTSLDRVIQNYTPLE